MGRCAKECRLANVCFELLLTDHPPQNINRLAKSPAASCFVVAPLCWRSSVRNMTKEYTGKCLCGEVQYTADGPPIVVAQCHCEECRRLSGTGHTVGAMFVLDAVSVSGKLSEFSYSSDIGSEVTKVFCASCGSPIYGKNTRLPDHLTLSLGTMDDARGLEVEVVIFERDKPHWDQLGEDVVSFATQPD